MNGLPIAVLLLSISFITLNAADLSVTVRTNVDGRISTELSSDALDLGSIRSDGRVEKSIELKNSLKKDASIGSLRSPCVCLDAENVPETLQSGSAATIKIVLSNAAGMHGAFSKYLYFKVIAGKSEKDIFVPLKFTIWDDDATGEASPTTQAVEGDSPIKFVDYKGGGLGAFPMADAWIFAGKGCPGCNFLKATLLPKLFQGKTQEENPTVVNVCLDEKESFIFLSDLETKLGAKGDKTPVLYYGGKLIYGNEAVKALIEEQGAKN